MLGNFPQAFSHLGLVNTAWHLSEVESYRPVRPSAYWWRVSPPRRDIIRQDWPVDLGLRDRVYVVTGASGGPALPPHRLSPTTVRSW